MKKVLSLLLCLCMMFSVASILSSCSKDNFEPKVSKKTVEVNLTDYEIVFASDLSNTAKTQTAKVAKKLSALTETPIRETGDGETAAVETEDLEILVGKTNRVETVKVMKGLGDLGWAIRVFDNKICIVGTTTYLTLEALNYFERNYITEDAIEGTKITLNQQVTQKKLDTVELVEEVEDPAGNYLSGRFQIVYDDLVDDVKNTVSYGGDPNPVNGGQNVDYRYDLAVQIGKSLYNNTTAEASTFLKKDDTKEETEYEVLVGLMDRDIVREELNKIEANQYGLAIRDNKIILLGWNDVAIQAASVLFEELSLSCIMDNGKGKLSYVVPEYSYILYTLENKWDVNFPKPEGEDLYLHGTEDVGDDSLEYVYTGNGANEAAFHNYCKKLEDAGYTLHGLPTEGQGNLFRYYVHKGTGSALYVYYAPYSFAAEQQVRNDYLPGIRIIASNTAYVSLPDSEILDPNLSYTKICDSTITALQFDNAVGSWGLSYVIRLEDGSFVIFDGGAGMGWDGAENMYEVLLKLYREVFPENEYPTSAEPLHVRAWLLTHEHMDHYTVFKQFVEKYGGNNWFRLDYFLFNATSKSQNYNCDNPEKTIRSNLKSMQDKVVNGFEYIKVHTGQAFYFANLKIEIMYTHEDTYPLGLEYFNNSSTTFKTTFMNNGVAADTGIWLGDLERIGSRRLRAMWGNEGLKADMVQVAHHGYNGVEAELYDCISPKIVWYPAQNYAHIAKDTHSFDNSSWMYAVDHHLCFNISTVKLIIMSDNHDTTMVFKGGRGDLNSLYDIKTGESLGAENNIIIYK